MLWVYYGGFCLFEKGGVLNGCLCVFLLVCRSMSILSRILEILVLCWGFVVGIFACMATSSVIIVAYVLFVGLFLVVVQGDALDDLFVFFLGVVLTGLPGGLVVGVVAILLVVMVVRGVVVYGQCMFTTRFGQDVVCCIWECMYVYLFHAAP